MLYDDDLCAISFRWFIHQCCAVDCTGVSRRNHVFDLFFHRTKYWVAHFDVEAAVLEKVTFHIEVHVNIRRHHCWHQETKHKCGCFVAIVVGEVFCALNNGIRVTLA